MLDRIFTWFESRYSPVALAEDRQPPMGLWRFYWYFIRQFRAAYWLRMMIVAVAAIVDAMLPIFVGLIVGALTNAKPGDFFAVHGPLLVMMAFVVLLRPLSMVIDALIRNHAIAPNLIDLIRWQSHWHVVRQDWSFFQNDFAGRIGTKVMQSGDSVEMSVNLTVDAVWYALVFVAVAIVVLARLDPLLLAVVAVWLVFYCLIFWLAMPRITRRSSELSERWSQVSGRMVDSYTNILTLKTFSTGEHEDRYVSQAVVEHADTFYRLMRVFTLMWSSLFVLNATLLIAISWLALAGWNAGAMTTAAVATAIPFALQIANISGRILDVGANVFRQIGVASNSMTTIARPITMQDNPGAPALVVKAGGIEFDRVNFNYWRKDGKGGVIDNLSLTIAPGERVGLIGRSGAGKSTLVNLVLRLFDVQDGKVLIDGQDIRNVSQESVRAAIGFVNQDTSLLHRSVRENLKYGRQSASDETMFSAAKAAQIDDVIAALTDPHGQSGYEALVGERGVKLSGGQRQRIAIARVMLKDAPILILDEATSALDSEVEAAIQENLYKLMQGKTVIAIAHRLSTIAAMDRLVVMDKGRIVEDGSHETLIAKGGLYAQLWRRQSGGFLLEDKQAAGDLATKGEAAE
ncbi:MULTISPECIES: ABC transporter ATP-binding protein [unclassified Mesorhizobium]|uniref:ABC transporter ATP-binding protein n=1 Tax=unclassified Mesorhizobium TaxID=325217 RepID=UPI00112C4B43|nr:MULTISPECIES: ABC transporter ATP-binding protein [unclassified Mesorhizobium]TPL02043.1 ABC transporter ATP-binding protein [Mesorhizobium sp. B2-4-16]TPL78303.1 ABC transporter ATP-binding protein [Mesorhizobium sp. B2-4-3]